MREILFRGKDIKTDKWIFGCLIDLGKESNTDKARYGITPSAIPIAKTKSINGNLMFLEPNFTHFNVVIPEIKVETIGQYTGLTDINGTKIFEGDVVKAKHYWQFRLYPNFGIDEEKYFFEQKIRGAYGKHKTDSNFSNYNYFYYRNYAVEYFERKGEYRVRNGSCFNSLTRNFIFGHSLEVIGNIHDNSELLKGE